MRGWAAAPRLRARERAHTSAGKRACGTGLFRQRRYMCPDSGGPLPHRLADYRNGTLRLRDRRSTTWVDALFKGLPLRILYDKKLEAHRSGRHQQENNRDEQDRLLSVLEMIEEEERNRRTSHRTDRKEKRCTSSTAVRTSPDPKHGPSKKVRLSALALNPSRKDGQRRARWAPVKAAGHASTKKIGAHVAARLTTARLVA
ncbi:hypothetical protein KFL_005870060 [Klebsormidium nitens]|uniref:Uncharacterized protein n=1 Tax=Klebsormidium nitens TaxID=105231 RepID=A0A1Y1IMH7_KLENI|nr:hypothetical protein KFL_005870060 [Klebsormidium nitens]|eukprot:GAQ89996.1 hypothetical protein KFL_005870060 [Klebsormidium nitens]